MNVESTANKPPDSITLTIFDGLQDRYINTVAQQSVLGVLRQQGIYVNAPCGGRGTCGKCRIRLLTGRLLVMNEQKCSRLANPGESVLACRATLQESCRIDISELTELGFAGTVAIEPRQPEKIDTGYEKVQFIPVIGIWDAGHSVVQVICRTLDRQLSFSAKALRQLSGWMGASIQQHFMAPDFTVPIWLTIRENRVLQVRTEAESPLYGIGVDIGTTTIAVSLVDLETGGVARSVTLLNSQRQFGADVISRVQKGTEGLVDQLQACLRSDLARGVSELCRQEAEAVVQLVIAGNTTMLHLLLGLQADSLAVYPFNPVTQSQMSLSTAELFGAFPIDCEVLLLPSLGAYIGADVIAGLLNCRIDKTDELTVLIDLGTNGEMAIGNAERILCTSTAAGPAFEGTNISCGVGSVPGAISQFDIQDGKAMIKTIGDAPPIGICGSGVVDIVAAGLRAGLIDRTGRLQTDEMASDRLTVGRKVNGDAIVFSQKDVREFQLAKAAIRSGLEILLIEYGCNWADVRQVFLAGGFGSTIDVANAIEVGLIPEALKERIKGVGNSALGGTVAYLLHRERRDALARLLDAASCIDLSRHSAFNDLFMSQLDFSSPNK